MKPRRPIVMPWLHRRIGFILELICTALLVAAFANLLIAFFDRSSTL